MSYHIIADYFPEHEYFSCKKCMFIRATDHFYLTKYVRTCPSREDHSELIRNKINEKEEVI